MEIKFKYVLFWFRKKLLIIIMRTFILLCCITAFSFTPNNVLSQNTKVKIDADNTLTVDEVFDLIMEQTDYKFIYQEGIFKNFPKVKVKRGIISANKLLQKGLSGGNFNVVLSSDNTVLVKERTLDSIKQQEITVSGIVVDINEQPLPDANILEKGTTNGTQTDFDGKFSITVSNQDAILMVSYIGFQTKEIIVGGQTNVNVSLVENTSELDEVVVVVGYSTQRKSDLTGAVSSLSGKKLNLEQPVTIDQALKGKIAGVQIVVSDGAPGAGVEVKIRGANSLTAGSSPLYIVDGFPYPITTDPSQNPLLSIAPEMIEDIVILKDASSTAIYGAQGANGVVQITTKKARVGHKDINIKLTSGVSRLKKEMEMLSPETYLNNFMYNNLNRPSPDFADEYEDEAWNDPSKITDWLDETMGTGKRYGLDFSYLAATKKMQNALFFSMNDEQGIVKNTRFKRYSLRSNNVVKLTDKLKLHANLSFEMSERSGSNWNVGGLFNSVVTFSPFIPKDFTYKDMDSYLPNQSGFDNPYRLVMDNEYSRKNLRSTGDFKLSYQIVDGLNIENSFGISFPTERTKSYAPTTLKYSDQNNGQASFGSNESKSWRSLTQVNYHLNFLPEDHHLQTLAGYEMKKDVFEAYHIDYTHFTTEMGWYGISALQLGDYMNSPDISYNAHTMASVFGRIDYRFKDRYLITGNLRSDGSSRFGSNKKWGMFPSAALAWRLSDEEFFQNSKFISNIFSNAKVRLSYGQVGNDQINDYRYASFLNTLERYAVFGDGNTTIIPYTMIQMSNEEVTWETTSEFNFGLEFGMFNNKIDFKADLYKKKTTNMLLNQKLPLTTGFDELTINSGSVENKGIELTLNAHLFGKKDFFWDATINFSMNRSKIIDLGEREQILAGREIGNSDTENILLREGYPMGVYFGYVINGIMNDENSHNNANTSNLSEVQPNGQNSSDPIRSYPNGNFTFYDVDGDGRITDNDRMPIAHVEPKFIGGMSHYFSYKMFDLGLNFSWSYGNDILNGNIYSLISAGNGINNQLSIISDNTWNGLNRDGTYLANGSYRGLPNSEIVEDGSFLFIIWNKGSKISFECCKRKRIKINLCSS